VGKSSSLSAITFDLIQNHIINVDRIKIFTQLPIHMSVYVLLIVNFNHKNSILSRGR
jgi:hypothetical protein